MGMSWLAIIGVVTTALTFIFTITRVLIFKRMEELEKRNRELEERLNEMEKDTLKELGEIKILIIRHHVKAE